MQVQSGSARFGIRLLDDARRSVELFVFGLRRRLIQRSGGTFDCSLRWDVSEEPDPSGKGWVYGVARYSGDRVDWFRVFSYSPRPRRGLERSAIEVVARRLP